ncbi:MAG: ribosome maturation factor RimP [Alphaproteobacteria bacterium]|jgi:ribosome maturation factor RimP|nr:ribosome maturation factor RimP [Alphaproteobacteria bacterium]MBL8655574.1 ribosome maturation factor RimP [Alphaproteobacteria bacterium]MCA0451520.1 ribosome maturation factor RimP [Pseudomonadota bacterium]
MDRDNALADLIEPTVDAMGYELVRVIVAGRDRPTLQIMAERKDRKAMTLGDCENLSRAVSAKLDVEDPIKAQYVLEVSSPGIDRPLTRGADFDRFKGHEARIETKFPVEGRKRFSGRLGGREGDAVRIETQEGPATLPLAEIARAKLLLTDELIAATRAEEAAAAASAV